MSTDHGVDLYLSRFAEGEWRGVVRPWLEASSGNLGRSLVVAPTRGHTHALKRRCLAERVPLLGVEFLTPGLARRKRGGSGGPDRRLQVLVLRTLIESRLSALAPDDDARLVWKSLSSDLEAALADFEELLAAGFRAGDFPRRELRELFGEFTSWMVGHGMPLGPLLDEAAGLAPPGSDEPAVADRLLILAGGPERRGEFFNLVALARRSLRTTVVLPEPEGALGEGWVEMWEKVLGVEPSVVDFREPSETCASVSELWSGGAVPGPKARILVGTSRDAEMESVASEISALLGSGADNIGVVFPAADSAHARLARLLDGRGIVFADLLGACGTAPIDTQVQRALAGFYAGGCSLEGLLALYPLLRTLGLAKLPLSGARKVCEELFEASQAHGLERHLDALKASERNDHREVGRVAGLLLPPWPAALSLSDALARFEAARDRLGVGAPSGWQALHEFARRADLPMPSSAILAAILEFLPEDAPLENARPRGAFAHVTLTTLRRAAGVSWSHVIFVESNQGVWPVRREPSCWLDADDRAAINGSARFSVGLLKEDERAALERSGYGMIARDTAQGVTFSACLHDAEDPELRLEPNAWLERVMWDAGLLEGDGDAGAFGRLAAEGGALRPTKAEPDADLQAWGQVWSRRRDPGLPFDAWFFSHRPSGPTARLSARLIEKGLEDPIELWFGAVLGVKRVEWKPFARTRQKLVGTAVHGVLAKALRRPPEEGVFFPMPEKADAEASLDAELAALRARWPSNRYWESFALDVGGLARDLLGQVYGFQGADYAAVEVPVPETATIPVGGTSRIPVRGRMDLVMADQPSWEGADLRIVDFKTGKDAKLSVRSMATKGASLQLGIYLEAARSVSSRGSVWMLRPRKPAEGIQVDDLGPGLARLALLGQFLATGSYGALTPDRAEFTSGFEWPLACAPISHAVLRGKFEGTFGASEDPDDD